MSFIEIFDEMITDLVGIVVVVVGYLSRLDRRTNSDREKQGIAVVVSEKITHGVPPPPYDTPLYPWSQSISIIPA